MSECGELKWFVDELSYFRGTVWIRGWAFHPEQRITAMGCILPGESYQALSGYGLPSQDVEAAYGAAARDSRFSASLPCDSSDGYASIRLVFKLDKGGEASITNLVGQTLELCQPRQMERDFYARLAQQPGGRILEIGSRNVTGALNRKKIPPSWKYV